MALSGWTDSTNYLYRNSLVVTTYPFALDGWGYLHTVPNWYSAIVIGDSSTTDWRGMLGLLGTDSVLHASARSVAAGTVEAISATPPNVPADTWFYWTATFISDQLVTPAREVYLNAANRGTSGEDCAPATADRVKIGVAADLTSCWDASGALGEIAVWNLGAMNQTQREALWAKRYNGSGATGQNPLAINAEVGQPWTNALVAYWRLTNNTDLNDLSGNGHNLSMQGTVTNWGGAAPPVDATPASGTPISVTFRDPLNQYVERKP